MDGVRLPDGRPANRRILARPSQVPDARAEIERAHPSTPIAEAPWPDGRTAVYFRSDPPTAAPTDRGLAA